jgi:hypothetical protein
VAANKRTRFEVERDRALIAELYLQRHTQADIAERLGMTQQMVSYDLKAIERQWQEASVEDLAAIKRRLLDEIEVMEAEYWRKWRQSEGRITQSGSKVIKLPPQKVADVEVDSEGKPRKVTRVVPGGERAESYVRHVDQMPDMDYQRGIQWCKEQKAKLLGLYAPTKVAPTDPSGEHEYGELTDEERAARVVALLERARARRDGGPSAGAGGERSSVEPV